MTITAWLRWQTVSPLLPREARRVLDIGAGAGSIGSFLASRYEYVGIEPDPVSYAEALERLGGRGTLRNCGFEELEPHGDFDLVCAFEVLEHIEDDTAALSNWVRHARPGGWVLVSVPQGRKRYAAGDARVGHYRRYDSGDLVALFEGVGLEQVETQVYGAPWGNVQEAVRRVVFTLLPGKSTRAERTAESGRFLRPPTWASSVARAASVPFGYLQRPLAARGIGTGVVALGRRPLDG
jgi:SAM-dependent methyltransferase